MSRLFEFMRYSALAAALAAAPGFAQTTSDPNNPATPGTRGYPGDTNREPYRDTGREHSFGWIGLLGLAGLGGLASRRRDTYRPTTDPRNTPRP
jgi:MYXO-CTERM domain-containing protein